MNLKAELKKRIYTVWFIKRIIALSYNSYKIRSAIGLKTRGNSQFRFLAFNKFLEGRLGKVLTVGVVKGEDFSEQELTRLQKWSLRYPENHITICVHPYKKICKVVAGEKYASLIDNMETQSQTEKVNALFQDNQFIKGVHEMVEYIRVVLGNKI